MSLLELSRLAIPLARATGNWARWIRRVSREVDAIVIGEQPGVLYEVRFPVGTTTVDAAKAFPANAIVHYGGISVLVPYTVGTTLSLGTAAAPTLFLGTAENAPTAAIGVDGYNLFDKIQDRIAGVGFPRVTVLGAPVAGSARGIIIYSVPFV
jgi:hypothetical protein